MPSIPVFCAKPMAWILNRKLYSDSLMPRFPPFTFVLGPGAVPGDDRARLTPADGWIPFGDVERSIPDCFVLQVQRHADRQAVRMGTECLTYQELADRAYRVAHAILARRGDQEEPIALLLEQGPGLIAAILGVLAAGKIYVSLDPAHPPERNRRALADCEPPLLLSSPAEAGRARAWMNRDDAVLDLGALGPGLPCTDPRLDLKPDRLAYIFYTSGSTGGPKGVADCHRDVLHNVLRYTDSLRIGCADRLTLLQSCAFSGSVSSLFAALLTGACSHPLDLRREGVQGLARRIEDERVTMFHGVPAIFRELAATSADLTSLRVIRLEGDLAGPRDAELFRRRFGAGCTLVNGLGATETGLSCQYFLAPDSPVPSPTLPVGYPTAGVEVDVVDDAGLPASAGEIGEIVVRSRYRAVGYWRNPALTEAMFRPGSGGARRYLSGDLGRRRADGAIELLGRKDLQVKLRGEWVDTAAVEAALLGLGLAREAAVVPRELRPGRLELVAYLVAAGDPPPEAGAVRSALAARHPGLPLPTRWRFLRAMPQDANGKLDRARLPDPDPQRPPRRRAASVASGTDEAAVLACWREVLGRAEAGVDDTFAFLGGDSFAALELALLLETRLGVAVPPDLVDAGTTVARLAARLSAPAEAGSLVPLATGGSGPLLFLFHGVQGHLVGYHALARRLAPDHPVYGLRFPSLADRRPVPWRVHGLAALYAAQIVAARPTGRPVLAGNCMGGLLALETARRLRAAGVEVPPAVLVDTAYPGGLLRRVLPHAAALARGRPSESPSHEALPTSRPALARKMAGWAVAKLRRRGVALGWAACDAAGWRMPAWLCDSPDLLRLAESRYRPRPAEDRAVLVCAGAVTNQAGWERVARAGLEVVLLPRQPGAPRAAPLVEEPYVDLLAEALRQRLRA
jgi:amino acid adenylation domain-containing protein